MCFDLQKEGLMIKKYWKSLTIALAILCFLFFSQIQVHAQGTQTKKLPGVPLLLLSETPSPQPNIAFVTSVTYNGNLGGLAGADQKCQALATAAGLPQNTYKAWLSTSSVNAIDRLGTARGWVRVDGKPFADTKADIVAGKTFHPLRVDEKGNYDNQAWGSGVWTGTRYDGTVHPVGTCSDWISSSGSVFAEIGHDDGVVGIFTSFGSGTCERTYPLYCFGVNNNVPVTVTPVTGRIAFLTRAAWIPSNGLAAADALCQAEAIAAGVGNTLTFKALLADVGHSAASRFNSSSGSLPWVRPDGVAVTPTAAALFSADFLDTAIAQSADGLQYFGGYDVWTGASDPTAAGTTETTCNNWASSSDTSYAMTGMSGSTYKGYFFTNSSNQCSVTWRRLYCLQE
jgi:hypothetical protein